MGTTERIDFVGGDGRARLAGRLERPDGRVRAVALFAHCFACGKDVLAAVRVARALAGHGIATLRFDFTGLGDSEGDTAATGFSANVADVVAAAAHLRAIPGLDPGTGAPAILIGHSLGGTAVLAAAARVPEAVAVCTIGAPADSAHVARRLGAGSGGEIEVGGRPFRLGAGFLEDVAGNSLEAAIASLGKALLVMHAPADPIVGIENASRIFLAARHPKSFVSLDDADHLLSRPRDAAYVATVIAAWADRYVGRAAAEEAPRAAAAPGTVVVEESGSGRFAQAIDIGGRFRLRADEPSEHGGTDSGPTPYDFLLAGLGACTAMTVRMYAERKQLRLDHVRVSLRHEKIHAEDCADCETRTGMVDRIERDIELTGDLDASALARLMEIADKCPVHRTLHSEVKVATRRVGGE